MSFRKTLLFYTILFASVLLIIEILVRSFFATPAFFKKFANSGDGDAPVAWRLMWAQRHKGDKVIDMADGLDLHHPVRGWQTKPLLKEHIFFKNKKVTTNSKGIRDEREIPYERTPGKKRILVFGDSFTFGTEVSNADTYPAYLQRLLPEAEVLNMGVHGYGHDQMLLYLKEEGVKYKPDIVILGYLYMDTLRNSLTFRDYAKPKFDLKNGKLVLTNTPVPHPQHMLWMEPFRLRSLDLISLARWQAYGRTTFAQDNIRLSEAILMEFVETVRSMGAVPIFAYLDNIRDRSSKIPSSVDKEFINKWQDRDVVCAFPAPAMKAVHEEMSKGQETYYRPSYHFTPRENEVVALVIAKQLRSLGLLD